MSDPHPPSRRALRLRTWLILGYAAVLLLAVVGLGLGLATVLGLSRTSASMMTDNLQALDLASRLRSLTTAQQLAVLNRQDDAATAAARAPAFQSEAQALLDEARSLTRDPDELARIEDLQRAVDALVETLSARAAEAPAAVPAFAALSSAALAFYQHHHRALADRGERIRQQSQRLALALALLAGFTVLVGVLASLRLARRLSAPMERLAEAAERVAELDFAVRLPRSGLFEADRVAERFERMSEAIARFHAIDLERILGERRRLDHVISAIDDGLVIFDEDGRIERMNPVAELQLDLDAGAAVGRRLEEVGGFPGLADEVATLVAAPASELGGDTDLVVGDGEQARTLSYSLLPFSDAARVGLILVLRDVSEARQFERMRTEFVLRASHELRTPVTGLRMALGLLRGRLTLAPESRELELLQTLDTEIERLVRLIEDLLDLSRLYARSRALKRERIAPEALLQRCLQRFAPLAAEAGIALVAEVAPELPSLSLDAAAIDRVLDNLVANAIRHTPRGGRIELLAQAGRQRVVLAVRDSGEGIPRHERARVFEPFVQIGRRRGGSGLGLALCRELVEQHGGEIRLASRPGRGSTFSVVLPT